MRSPDSIRSSRAAFTLIELLVVMGIIALLSTIAVMAIAPTLENAKINATKVTINQINEVIQQRLDAIGKLDLASESKRFAARSGLSEPSAKLLLQKNLLRQALPQRVEDLGGLDLNLGTASDNSPAYSIWQNDSPAGPPAHQDDSTTESAEVLFYALTKVSQVRLTSDGKSFNVPLLSVDNLNPKHVADTNGNGYSEFVDAWEQPLQFYRWPTRLIRPGGVSGGVPTNITAAQRKAAQILLGNISQLQSSAGDLSYSSSLQNPLNQDPNDPAGIVGTNLYGGGTASVAVPGGSPSSITANAYTEANYHTPNTYWTPLLMSSGPDQVLGMGLPTAALSDSSAKFLGLILDPTSTDFTDNITNRQQ